MFGRWPGSARDVIPPAAATASATRAPGLSSYRPGWATAPLTKMRTVGGAGGSTVAPTGTGAAADAWWRTDQPATPARTRVPTMATNSLRGVIPDCMSSLANIHGSVAQGRLRDQAHLDEISRTVPR